MCSTCCLDYFSMLVDYIRERLKEEQTGGVMQDYKPPPDASPSLDKSCDTFLPITSSNSDTQGSLESSPPTEVRHHSGNLSSSLPMNTKGLPDEGVSNAGEYGGGRTKKGTEAGGNN